MVFGLFGGKSGGDDELPLVFAPHDLPTVPVLGRTQRFPVRRIYCVGRNYAAHAREMGADPSREPPFFFSKPADAVVTDGRAVHYPSATQDLHHEVELVIAIGGTGRHVPIETATNLIFGWAVGIDLTRRDLQAKAKAQGRPWDVAKGFDQSAPIGAITTFAENPNPQGSISLMVDGIVRQSGDLSDMIWSPAEIVAEASRYWTLEPGDLIFTGTPEGVGPVVAGQSLYAQINGLSPVDVSVLEPLA